MDTSQTVPQASSHLERSRIDNLHNGDLQLGSEELDLEH